MDLHGDNCFLFSSLFLCNSSCISILLFLSISGYSSAYLLPPHQLSTMRPQSFLRADSESDLWTLVSVEAVLSSSWKVRNLSFLELCCDLSFGNFFVIWSAYWKVFRYFSFVQFFYSIHPSIHPSQCRAIVGEPLLLNMHLISLDSAGFLSCFFITSG